MSPKTPSPKGPALDFTQASPRHSLFPRTTMLRQQPATRIFSVGAGCLLLLIFIFYQTSPHTVLSRPALFSPSTSIPEVGSSVFNATLGFQKIYVIDLPKRFDHRDGLSLAASMTGLELEYVDGVSGLEKGYLPEDYWKTSLDDGALYCWRAHLNVARLMVEQNIASALILEGDQDWDIRIKEQMYLYSEAARQYISQPEEKFRRHVDFAPNTVPGAVDAPYGKIDDWDMHWIGHCGMDWAPDDSDIPSGRVVIQNDDTIPESQHIDFGFGRHDLAEEYANHTRVVAHAKGGICMGAYALSLPGARNWLFRLGIESLFSAIDVMAQGFCDGWGGRPINKCLSSVPPLFSSHRPAGNASAHSDIGHHQGHVDKAYSKNVRWSTRLNLGKLVEGRTDYIDSYKDQTPQP